MTTPAFRVTTAPLDDDRPLLAMLPDDHGMAWVRAGDGIIAWGVAHRVPVGVGPGRLEQTEARLDAVWDAATTSDAVGVPGSGCIAMISVTFDEQTPGSRLVIPRRVVGRRNGRTWFTTIDPVTSEDATPPLELASGVDAAEVARDRVRYAGSSQPDVHYLEAVAAATELIDSSDLEKVVLARDHAVWSKTPFALRPLLARLAHRYPECWTFAMDGLVGASPELLIRRLGSTVTSMALAGTAGRDDDPDLDAKLLAELQSSDKMAREHRVAADSVESALRPHTTQLVRGPVDVLRLANVQHLATTVTGELAQPVATALSLTDALHPTAAVGGTPTEAAMRAIRELEGMDRGRYAGPVGWVAADGDGELAIALRCAEFSGARARLFAGAGIVAGSLPEDELLETRMKLRAMQEALA